MSTFADLQFDGKISATEITGAVDLRLDAAGRGEWSARFDRLSQSQPSRRLKARIPGWCSRAISRGSLEMALTTCC